MNKEKYKKKYSKLLEGRIITNNLTRKQKYDIYMSSNYWRTRSAKLRKRKYKCSKCHSRDDLTVHHKSYDSLFKEKISHLEVLCWLCHKKRHL